MEEEKIQPEIGDITTLETEVLENESGLDINDENDSISIYPNAEVRVEKDQFSIFHLNGCGTFFIFQAVGDILIWMERSMEIYPTENDLYPFGKKYCSHHSELVWCEIRRE